jgi:hypothetical protein
VADNIFLGGNPPFQPMVSIANGDVDQPGGGAATAFPQFFMTQDPVYKIPSAWNWNAAVQREIGFSTTLELGYVGRVGLHQERTRELNALQPGTIQANPGLDVNFLRPYKGFAFINLGENAGRSVYHGLQVEMNRRFSNGFSYGLAYTLSKVEDNAHDRRAQPWNPFDDRIFWGPSDFDSRHVAVVNFVYELPALRDRSGIVSQVLGGWQLSGVMQFQTGRPTTIGRTTDIAGIGSGNQFQPYEMNGDATLPRGERAFSQGAGDQNFWWRTTEGGNPIFTAPAAGTFSQTQTRNLLNRPGFQNWNLGVFKNFPIGERQRIQLRGEFFNLPNHPNFGTPNEDPASAVFGKVTNKTNDRRNIQLSLRYSF